MISSLQDPVLSILQSSDTVFWDFDGVIKDSVDVKTVAFESLFLPYGGNVADRVRRHHEANGGVSRYEKMPLYLSWAGEKTSDDIVSDFCSRFGGLVKQAVIDSPWVPGVREYILASCSSQYFVLVTATPQNEIQHIIKSLGIDQCFREVHGAPKKKADVIRGVLRDRSCLPSDTLMVGDSEVDFVAADINQIPFLLRQTLLNQEFQSRHAGPMFGELNYE